MKDGHPDDLSKFMSNNAAPQGELNHNGVIGPNVQNNTVFSSHKDVKEVKLEDLKY